MSKRKNEQTSLIEFSLQDLTLKERLDSLPTKPGVYQFKNAAGKVLYVGKAQNLRLRVRQYFQASRSRHPRVDALVSKVSNLETIVTDTEVEALILEANLIKKLKPRYNVDLKDDKSYPFIVITNEPYPRVFVTRRIIKDGSKYFGPYTDVRPVRFALKTMRDIFMVRSCNYDVTDDAIRKKKFKVCLDYHIRKCGGGCEGIETKEHYNEMITQVADVLRGRTSGVVEKLNREMETYAEQMRFEEAAAIRDRIRALEVYRSKQKIVDPTGANRDVIAVAVKEDDACGVIFKVREGKVLGRHHYYMRQTRLGGQVGDIEESELIEAVIKRFYIDNQDIPPEIVLSTSLATAGLVSQWLTQQRNGEVRIESPKSGEKAKLVGLVQSNARYLLEELLIQKMKRGDFVPSSVRSLQRDLRLPIPPRRMECFDVSNIQGSDTVASMIVFVDGKPKKGEYRRYKIKGVSGPDDYASLREVVHRRYKRLLDEQITLPDLIVIDGGKGQLSSAHDVLQQLNVIDVPIIGLAKRLEEVFVPDSNEAFPIPRTSSSLRLLKQIRNEAHRVAVTYHRMVRSKRVLESDLDLISGIGKKRAKELLEAFGSVQGIKFATEEQLTEIVGYKVATQIKDYYSQDPIHTQESKGT